MASAMDRSRSFMAASPGAVGGVLGGTLQDTDFPNIPLPPRRRQEAAPACWALERRRGLCEADAMTETSTDRPTLPDRLATDPDSPFYDADILAMNVGVRFKGEDKTNVD